MPTRVDPPAKGQRKRRPVHDHSAEAEEAAPQMAGAAGPPPPQVVPEPCFHFLFSPQRWTVIAGQVVPQLSKLEHKAGWGGVDMIGPPGRERPNIGIAAARAANRGEIILQHNVDGAGRSYVKRVKSTGGWISRWETLFSGSAARLVDDKGYATWLRELIDRGVLPPPAPHVLAAMLEEVAKRIEVWVKASPTGYAQKIEAAKADLEAVRAELAAVEDELEEVDAEESAPELA